MRGYALILLDLAFKVCQEGFTQLVAWRLLFPNAEVWPLWTLYPVPQELRNPESFRLASGSGHRPWPPRSQAGGSGHCPRPPGSPGWEWALSVTSRVLSVAALLLQGALFLAWAVPHTQPMAGTSVRGRAVAQSLQNPLVSESSQCCSLLGPPPCEPWGLGSLWTLSCISSPRLAWNVTHKLGQRRLSCLFLTPQGSVSFTAAHAMSWKPLLGLPSGPVVKTLPSRAVGIGSVPGREAKIPHASGTKKINKRRGIITNSINTFKWSTFFLKKSLKKSCYLIFGCFRHEGKFSSYFPILAWNGSLSRAYLIQGSGCIK